MNVDSQPHQAAHSAELCLACGLCCNGVIFADVMLQPEDVPARLRALGLPVSPVRNPGKPASEKFSQPCAMFDGCRCRIYADRPAYCRAFDCALLQAVQREQISMNSALRNIKKARRLVDEILGLLRSLGDIHEDKPLLVRARNAVNRLASADLGDPAFLSLAKLTCAIHKLGLLLSRKFYPGA